MAEKVSMRKGVMPDCRELTEVQVTGSDNNDDDKWLMSISTHCSTCSMCMNTCISKTTLRCNCYYYPYSTDKAQRS